MNPRLRYIEETEIQSSAGGLAVDEALALSVAAGGSPALRLYSYRPCVIVGRFQNLGDAVDLDACRRHGHEWNRRHTGGGAVIMGPDQVAVALAAPDERGRFIGSVRGHFQRFAACVALALREFGVESELLGKNDLAVEGRKIAGLAISQDIDGAVFYHASLLLDFDVARMVELLHLPTRDLADRGQSCFSRRLTTLREHAPDASPAAVRAALRHAVEAVFAMPSETASLTAAERETTARLLRERYESEEWIYSSRVMRSWSGASERKTPGGSLRVYVALAGGALDSVMITGDYFCRTLDLARLEASLRGCAPELAPLLERIRAQNCSGIYRVEPAELAELIREAAMAKPPARERSHQPVCSES